MVTKNNIPNLELLKSLVGTEIKNSKSAAGNWLSVTLDKIETGYAELSVLVKPEMCNPFGNIHGGMMTLVIDESIGYAVISLEKDTHYTSVNINVDFLYAISQGETLVAKANIVRHGKRIINAEVSVFNKLTNQLLAKSTSNLCATGMKIIGD